MIGNNAKFAIEHLDIRTKSGTEWLALCPYHEDKNPSFSFNVRKGLFICYACGAKGNVQQLAEYLGVRKPSPGAEDISVDFVKDKIRSVFANRENLVEDNPRAEENVLLSRVGNAYIEQWEKRGITNPEVLNNFLLGYSEYRDALTIPLFNDSGRAVAQVFRNLSFKPKYQYPSNFKISNHLYGWWQATCLSMSQRLKALVVTEGSIDTLSMWEVGIPSVALLGSRVSTNHALYIKELDPRMLIVMTDMDTAGAQAALECEQMFRGTGILVVRASWPRSEAKDPAELTPERRIEIVNRSLT